MHSLGDSETQKINHPFRIPIAASRCLCGSLFYPFETDRLYLFHCQHETSKL